MKTRTRILLVLFLVVGAALLGGWFWIQEPLPEWKTGPEAEALAQRMLAAVDAPAWERTGAVLWSFRGQRHHLWDRQRSFARVAWGDVTVWLDLTSRRGLARRAGSDLAGSELQAALDEAWSAWCNDSFWLNPIAKIYDDGTERGLVETAGGPALLVHYRSGGVTPGDSYLWILDAAARPVSWRMWTQILPIPGLKLTWEGWQQLSTGAWISTRHQLGPRALELTGVRGAASLAELEPGADPFEELQALLGS
jgi:hypothetical protein